MAFLESFSPVNEHNSHRQGSDLIRVSECKFRQRIHSTLDAKKNIANVFQAVAERNMDINEAEDRK